MTLTNPYRLIDHRAQPICRGSFQQGLSAAGGVLGFLGLRLTADKRYSLGVALKPRSIKWSSAAGLFVCILLGAGGLLPYLDGKGESKGVWGAAFFAFCAFYYAYDLFRAKSTASAASRDPVGAVTVAFTDTTITAKYGNGETRSVAWASLTKIGITTTDEGPFVQDVFWGLHSGEEVAVAYPQDANGGQELLRAMQERLTDFDNRSVIEAMGSTSNAKFTVWENVRDSTA